MDCSCFHDLNQKEFEKISCTFGSRRELLFFLLNTLLNVKDFTDQLYYCAKINKQCLVCEMKIEFINNEYDLYEICSILIFLLNFILNYIVILMNYLK